MKFTIALAQIDSAVGDLKKNLQKHVEYINRAKEGSADIVVFPELSLSGYSIKDMNWDLALKTSEPKLFGDLLKQSEEIAILVGGVEESSEFGIYNAAFLIDHGMVTSVHRKIYPPTYGMFEELRYFSPGKTVRTCDASIGRIGVLICEDLWHLPLPYLLAQEGARIIFGMAASPTRLSSEVKKLDIAEVNGEQHRAFARLLSTYIVFCNRVGYEDGVNFWGGSEVIGPSGEVIVRAKLFDEDLVFAEIDENEVRRARRFSRHFLDDDPHFVLRELRRIAKQEGR